MSSPLGHGQGLGTKLWEVDFSKPAVPPFDDGTPGTILQPPIIAPDGSILVPIAPVRGLGGAVGSVNPDGTVKAGVSLFTPGSWYIPFQAIGTDGTTYASSAYLQGFFEPGVYGQFTASKPDGTIKWQVSRFLVDPWSHGFQMPAVSGNGVYVGSMEDSFTRRISAFDADGKVQWQFPLTSSFLYPPKSVTVGPAGTIHVWDGVKITSLNSDGSKIWEWSQPNSALSDLAIGADGAVYFGVNSNLCALSASGSNLWKFSTGGPILASPAVGKDGTIYFGSYDKNLYALNPDGTMKWAVSVSNEVNTTPALAADGTIYFGTVGTDFYAVDPTGTSSGPSLPREGHNCHR